MSESVSLVKRIPVLIGVVSLFFGGCSGDVDEPTAAETDAAPGIVEHAEEALRDAQDDPATVDPGTRDAVEADAPVTDIMAGERQMFLDAERKFNEAVAKKNAEGESEEKPVEN